VDGRSGNISVKEGNLVKANDVELVTIMQIQPVYVTFTVPEQQLDAIRARLRAGKLAVRATPQGSQDQTDEGTLTFIDNAVDQNTGTIKLKGTFTNGSARLWPGRFVDVLLTLNQRPNVIAIPSKAVQIGQSGKYVFVVKPDQTVEMRTVVTGDPVNGLVEVQQGVQAGEKVVTEGHIRLASGTRVKVQS
jgi:multidrug efflux system membrane fusion protein